jgi:hypothetical protein
VCSDRCGDRGINSRKAISILLTAKVALCQNLRRATICQRFKAFRSLNLMMRLNSILVLGTADLNNNLTTTLIYSTPDRVKVRTDTHGRMYQTPKKPPELPSNAAEYWHTFMSLMPRFLWRFCSLGYDIGYSRGYLWMLGSVWLAPRANLQGSLL